MNKRIFLAIFIGIFSIVPILGMDSQIASEGLKLISTYAIRAGICYAGNLADTLVHEGGHALAGIALGKKLEKIEIGDPNGKYVFALSKFSINPLDIKEGTTHFTNLKKGTKDFIITAAGPLASLCTIKSLLALAQDNKTLYYLLISHAILRSLDIIPQSDFWVSSDEAKSDGDTISHYIQKCLPNKVCGFLKRTLNTSLAHWCHLTLELGLLGTHYYYQYRAVFN